MSWSAIGLGVAIIVLGIIDAQDGASDFFFGPDWLHDYIQRDKHPLLFWICIGSYIVAGIGLIIMGIMI